MESSQYIKTSPDTVIHLRLSNSPSASQSNLPLIVFLHYWGGSSSTWYKLTSPTSQWSMSGRYPLVSLDFRGWGQSTGPATAMATPKDYSVGPNAADVVSVLEHLKASEATAGLVRRGIVLVGHSMGGKIALAALGRLSAELLGLVKGVILVAPAPPTPLVLPPNMSEEQKRAYETKESVLWTVQNVLAKPANVTEDDLDMLVRDSLKGSKLAVDGWPAHGMQEDIVPVLDEISTRPGVRNIKITVLAGELDVVEQKDRVEQEAVQTLSARGFPVRYTVIQDVKHLIPLESPRAISQAVSDLVIH